MLLLLLLLLLGVSSAREPPLRVADFRSDCVALDDEQTVLVRDRRGRALMPLRLCARPARQGVPTQA